MDFDAFRQQPLASALTTPSENGAPAFGLHARAEAELPFARALGCLIGAFHKMDAVEKISSS